MAAEVDRDLVFSDEHDQSEGQSVAMAQRPKTKINCDQVAWLKDVLIRYEQAIRPTSPRVARIIPAARMAALLEIMDILYLEPEDRDAAGNIISEFTELNVLRDRD